MREVQSRLKEAEEDVVPIDLLAGSRGEGEGPLFRVKFVLDNNAKETNTTTQTSLTTDLALVYNSTNQTIALHYNSLLFSSLRIQHSLASLNLLLSHVSKTRSSLTATIPLRTDSQTSILPDPSSDLDWCGFKGAIPDIFSRNAASHPNKPCVIQSVVSPSDGNGPSKERIVYTYEQIDKASNVLGHALKESGLQRGEVVMVYAARSVELVVCVMGVLKAGGVFSVIGE